MPTISFDITNDAYARLEALAKDNETSIDEFLPEVFSEWLEDYEAYMEALDNLEGLTPEELELVLSQMSQEKGEEEAEEDIID